MVRRVLMLVVAAILCLDFYLGEGPFAPQHTEHHTPKAGSVMLSSFSNKVRTEVRESLSTTGLPEEVVALAMGVLMGDKSQLTAEMKSDVRDAGMSHILAVSGLHIGIVWVLLGGLLCPLRLIGAGCHKGVVLLLLWGYILLIGAPPSALRAGIMLSLVQLSWLLHRDTWGMNNLCAAALLILMFAPHQLYDVGFQLSFLATAGILSLRPWLQEKAPAESNKAIRWLWKMRQLVLVSLGAQFLTLPLVAYYFHSVPIFAWVQALFVVPVLPFLIGVLLLMLLCSMLAGAWPLLAGLLLPVASVVASGCTLLADYLFAFARWITAFERWVLGGRVLWYPTLLEALLLLGALALLLLLLVKTRAPQDTRTLAD